MFHLGPFSGRQRWRWYAASAAGCLLGHASPGLASDFQIRRWTSEEGLPQNRIECLLQVRDGYLLVGARGGFLRFDGLEFTPAAPPPMADWLEDSVCTALLEDDEGRLWVGTKKGLGFWGDGAFHLFRRAQGLPADGIHCLAAARRGGLWVGTTGGLAHWDGEQFQAYPPPLPAAAFVHAVAEDGQGTVWVGSSAGLHRLDPDTGLFVEVWADSRKRAGEMGHGAESLAIDDHGQLWFGTRAGVGWVDPVRESAVAPGDPVGSAPPAARGLLLASSLGVWTFGPGGVACAPRGQWVVPPVAGELEGVTVRCALEDREGNLWLGTASDGLWRLRPRTVRTPNLVATLEHVPAWSLCPAPEGGLWVATERGLLRVFEDGSECVSLGPGRSDISLRCVLESRAGDLWIGSTEEGLFHFRRDAGAFVPVPKPAKPHQIRALYEDRAGSVWVGTKDGLLRFEPHPPARVPAAAESESETREAWWHFRPGSMDYHRGDEAWSEQDGIWRLASAVPTPGVSLAELRAGPAAAGARELPEGRLTDGEIHALLEDRQGRLWIGTGKGGLNRLAGGRFEAWGVGDGLGSQTVYALHEDAEGVLWIGTLAGLTRWREGRFFAFTEAHGLVEPLVNQIVDDGRGALWLGGHRGLTRVGRQDLNAVAAGQRQRVRCVVLTRAEGMPASETNGEVQPAGTRTPDGRLWFPTTHGLAVVDPVTVADPLSPAPVLIESVRATDRLLVRPFVSDPEPPARSASSRPSAGSQVGRRSRPVALPAGSGRFMEFHYASVNLTAPEKTRYRYQLQGHDNRWIEAGRQRAVSYANLRPGCYHFRVLAVDRHGIWSDEPAVFSFVLLSHWYQTSWLQLAVLLLLAAGILGIHHRRVHARVRLERLAAENSLARERARISRDLHDDLGAWLARALLLLGRLRRDAAGSREWPRRLGEVEASVRAGSQTMREVIWATDPDYDTLAELGTRLAVFAQEYLGPLEVRCRLDFPATWPPATVRAELRQGLFLAVKEALHNAVEHGEASEIHLALRLTGGWLHLAVADNGRGMAVGPPAHEPRGAEEQPTAGVSSRDRGEGLANLRRRVESVGGRLTITSNPGNGTTLDLEVPL
ncbi:MAG: ATP-binding protein [Verrucomicrobiales bacterium]|nr:ATP-binding protein [Verrucomicrobiales bacterium]